MKKWTMILTALFFILCAVNFLEIGAEDTMHIPDNGIQIEKNSTVKLLRTAWFLKPPYTISTENSSLDQTNRGLIPNVLLRYITVECGYFSRPPIAYRVERLGTNFSSESELIDMLKRNVVDIVAPIFEHPDNRKYKEFPFFKLDNYPGTDFLTNDNKPNALGIVLSAILESWPLLAVAMNLTAIAGIIMWALVGFNLSGLGSIFQVQSYITNN